MKSDFDLIIVGGGPVGASLACALAPTRLRVALVEASEARAEPASGGGERTLALAYGSRRILESIGVWSSIAGEAEPIERIHISDRGRFGFTRLTAAELGTEALGYVLPNRVLGRALYERFSVAERVQFFCPAQPLALSETENGVRVSLQLANGRRELTARLAVGADGADSALRRLRGIAARRKDYDQFALVTTVTPSEPRPGTAFERFTASGPIALLPIKDGRYTLVWSIPGAERERLLALSEREFCRALNESFGERLGEFTAAAARATYPLFLTRVDTLVHDRLVLIGNAAHTVHPVAGQGFNLGLRDVAALAETLAAAHGRGEDIGEPALLARYAAWRRRDTEVIARFTDGLARLFVSELAPLALARNLGLIGVDLFPPAKRGLLRVTSGLAGRLPRLSLGLPLPVR